MNITSRQLKALFLTARDAYRQIASCDRKLPLGAEDVTTFPSSYIAERAEPWSPAAVQAA